MISKDVTLDFLSDLLYSIDVAFTVIDNDDKIVIYNKAAEELFGDCAKEVIDKPVYQFHKEKTKPAVKEMINLFRNGSKQVISIDYEHKGKIVVERLLPIKNINGEYVGLVQIADYLEKYKVK